MITLGCDIGSLFSKVVVLDDDQMVGHAILRTTGDIGERVDELIGAALAEAGIDRKDVACLVSTGSGADLVTGATFTEDEVACVGAAASYYIPEIDTAIAVGGQHTTAMRLDDDGLVTKMMRNDKCASGSGRLLEVMGAKLNVELPRFDQTVSGAAAPVQISNQCGVFAESEVITYLNAGTDTADILAGICGSVGNIVVAQGRRFGIGRAYTLAGGVARLAAVTDVIREKLGGVYHPFPHDPLLAAALGAALLGDSE